MSGGFMTFARMTLVILTALFLALPSYPQASSGRISGTVRDESQSVIPNANIELKNTATGVVSRTISNHVGFYIFPGLVPGNYEMEASSSGMQNFTIRAVVQVQQSLVIDPILRVASSATHVDVVAVAPLVTVD